MIREVTDTVVKEMQDKHRQDLKNHAYNAFLLGAGGEMDYESYLIHLGLHEALEEEKDITAEEAIEKGRSILKMLG